MRLRGTFFSTNTQGRAGYLQILTWNFSQVQQKCSQFLRPCKIILERSNWTNFVAWNHSAAFSPLHWCWCWEHLTECFKLQTEQEISNSMPLLVDSHVLFFFFGDFLSECFPPLFHTSAVMNVTNVPLIVCKEHNMHLFKFHYNFKEKKIILQTEWASLVSLHCFLKSPKLSVIHLQ